MQLLNYMCQQMMSETACKLAMENQFVQFVGFMAFLIGIVFVFRVFHWLVD